MLAERCPTNPTSPELAAAAEVAEVHRALAHVYDIESLARILNYTHPTETRELIPGAQADPEAGVQLQKYLRLPRFYGSEHESGVRHTPLVYVGIVNGYEIFEKQDYLQPTGSFKERGARLKIMLEVRDNPDLAVVTAASAGNHALGVASAVTDINRTAIENGELVLDDHGNVLHGKRLEAHIYASSSMSSYKKDLLETNEMRTLGVTLHADYDDLAAALVAAEAYATAVQTDLNPEANSDAEELTMKAIFVPPYNDSTIMGGQGTQLIETVRDLLALGVPINNEDLATVTEVGGEGGGGLMGGQQASAELLGFPIATVGAQMEYCDAIARELYGEEPLTPEIFDKSCDGTAVVKGGERCMRILAQYSQGTERISKRMLAETMQYLNTLHGVRIEPAGALGMAGALVLVSKHPAPNDGRRHIIVAVTSGRNVSEETWNEYMDALNSPHEAKTYAPAKDPRIVQRVGTRALRACNGRMPRYGTTKTSNNDPGLYHWI